MIFVKKSEMHFGANFFGIQKRNTNPYRILVKMSDYICMTYSNTCKKELWNLNISSSTRSSWKCNTWLQKHKISECNEKVPHSRSFHLSKPPTHLFFVCCRILDFLVRFGAKISKIWWVFDWICVRTCKCHQAKWVVHKLDALKKVQGMQVMLFGQKRIQIALVCHRKKVVSKKLSSLWR